MAPFEDRGPSRRTLRELWLVAPLAGLVACADLVGADFNHAKPRPSIDAGAPSQGAEFGAAIAIDAHGLAITAPYEDVSAPAGDDRSGVRAGSVVTQGGALYYFDLDAPSAPPLHLVVPNVFPYAGVVPSAIRPYGYSPGLSRDSMRVALNDATLVVGVSTDPSGQGGNPFDDSAPYAGAVYAYDRLALTAQPAYVKAPTPHSQDLFGQSVALAGDRLVVGAPGEDNGAINGGAAYIYQRLVGEYVLQQRIQPAIVHPGDYFGYSVASDGDLIVVGAFAETAGPTGAEGGASAELTPMGNGAAYVFRLVGSTWTQETTLEPGAPGANGYFGASVAVSNGTIAVGTPGGVFCPEDVDSGHQTNGTVYLFTQQGPDWADMQCLRANSNVLEAFGFSVAMAQNSLVVGAPWDSSDEADGDSTTQFAGGSHLYTLDETSQWQEAAYLREPDIEANDVFGYSVAIVPGAIAVGAPFTAGGPHPQDASTYKGAAYAFPQLAGTFAASKKFLGY